VLFGTNILELSKYLSPCLVPLVIIIIGRDVLLSISAFYYRYISLPSPVSQNHISMITISQDVKQIAENIFPILGLFDPLCRSSPDPNQQGSDFEIPSWVGLISWTIIVDKYGAAANLDGDNDHQPSLAVGLCVTPSDAPVSNSVCPSNLQVIDPDTDGQLPELPFGAG
jgi:hypothetical protein